MLPYVPAETGTTGNTLLAKECDKRACVLKLKKQVRTVLATSAENWCKALGGKVLDGAFLCVSRFVIVRNTLSFAEARHGEFDPASTVVCGAHILNGDE